MSNEGLQSTRLSIQIDGNQKSITDYTIEVPDNLIEIQKNIEDKLGISELVN